MSDDFFDHYAAELREAVDALPGRRRRAIARSATALAALCAVIVAVVLLVGRDGAVPEAPARTPSTEGGSSIAVQAPSLDGGLPWGVELYANPGHKARDCARVGRVSGDRLGAVTGGGFRPYPASRTGACVDLREHSFVIDISKTKDALVVYARTRPSVARLQITVGGRDYTRPVSGNAVIFVLPPSSPFPTDDAAFDRNGKSVTF